MSAINLAQKLTTFSEHWQPRVVGQFNGHELMVVKVKGEFVWHKHEDTEQAHPLLIEPAGTSNTGNAATAAPRRTA